jgi:hypothetical protein
MKDAIKKKSEFRSAIFEEEIQLRMLPPDNRQLTGTTLLLISERQQKFASVRRAPAVRLEIFH